MKYIKKFNKKIGWGSISLPLCIAAILFSNSFNNGVCYGDNILNYLGLSSWSNGNTGTHYTIYYSIAFIVLAFFIGYKFENDLGAKIGSKVCLVIFTILAIIIVAGLCAILMFQYKNNYII